MTAVERCWRSFGENSGKVVDSGNGGDVGVAVEQQSRGDGAMRREGDLWRRCCEIRWRRDSGEVLARAMSLCEGTKASEGFAK